MPDLLTALICDHVRVEGSLAHVIAAGIDTVIAKKVPVVQPVGLLLRISLSRLECDRPHRIEVVFQDADGTSHARMNVTAVAQYNESLPAGWPVVVVMGNNLPLPLPKYGEYQVVIMIDDQEKETLRLRVVEPPPQTAVGGSAPETQQP